MVERKDIERNHDIDQIHQKWIGGKIKLGTPI